MYSRRYGRPPIDPVVMVKYLLVGFLCGIPSERQIEQIHENVVSITSCRGGLRLSCTRDCGACSMRQKCLGKHVPERRLERSYFTKPDWSDETESHHSVCRQALVKRLIWCEGTFSAQKRRHNLRQIFRRGLEAAEDHCLLSDAALNLKRMIKSLE